MQTESPRSECGPACGTALSCRSLLRRLVDSSNLDPGYQSRMRASGHRAVPHAGPHSKATGIAYFQGRTLTALIY